MMELNDKNQPEIITEWIPISITEHEQVVSGATPEMLVSGEQDTPNIVETIIVENPQKHEA